MVTFDVNSSQAASAALKYANQELTQRAGKQTIVPFEKIGDKVTISPESIEAATLVKKALDTAEAEYSTDIDNSKITLPPDH